MLLLHTLFGMCHTPERKTVFIEKNIYNYSRGMEIMKDEETIFFYPSIHLRISIQKKRKHNNNNTV